MEGVTNEAASLAGHWGLGKLIVFYDDNKVTHLQGAMHGLECNIALYQLQDNAQAPPFT